MEGPLLVLVLGVVLIGVTAWLVNTLSFISHIGALVTWITAIKMLEMGVPNGLFLEAWWWPILLLGCMSIGVAMMRLLGPPKKGESGASRLLAPGVIAGAIVAIVALLALIAWTGFLDWPLASDISDASADAFRRAFDEVPSTIQRIFESANRTLRGGG